MGVLPLVHGLPVRFTMTVDRERKVFKFSKGTLAGWCLGTVDSQRVEHNTNAEIVLLTLPAFVTGGLAQWL